MFDHLEGSRDPLDPKHSARLVSPSGVLDTKMTPANYGVACLIATLQQERQAEIMAARLADIARAGRG